MENTYLCILLKNIIKKFNYPAISYIFHAYTHYRSFFNRHYLCESLVWTCELSGQSNLTYTQALKSEEEARRCLNSLSLCYQRAALSLIHHARRTNLKSLTEEIVSFYKRRFVIGEVIDQSQNKANGTK